MLENLSVGVISEKLLNNMTCACLGQTSQWDTCVNLFRAFPDH